MALRLLLSLSLLLLFAPARAAEKNVIFIITDDESPMRAVRDQEWKLIWNIAHPLPYPFASDLWAASSFQSQYRKSLDAPYGKKTVGEYIQRPAFELFHISEDPDETTNLASDPEYGEVLRAYQEKMRALQKELKDPWIQKWEYE